MKLKKVQRPIGLDLFCGAGGMSLGFEQAGFDVLAAIDSDPIHINTYSMNFPHSQTICGDLSKLSGGEIRLRTGLGRRCIDVLFGGSPCQGFSLMGKRSPEDHRSMLLFDFARLAKELQPSYFVVENVEGLLARHARKFLISFSRIIRTAGYEVVEPIKILNACDFGVPQNRRRIFILGCMKGMPIPQYCKPKHFGREDGNDHPVVWDAISDLPDVDMFGELLENDVYHGQLGHPSRYAAILRGEFRDPDDCSHVMRSNGNGLTGCLRTRHTSNTIKRFATTNPGTYEPISRFYRLTKDGVANTLRAGTGPLYGSFTAPRPIHPIHPRCITVREAARLHSFPDWFTFHHTKWHGFRQVGNSVPPLLARAVANSILNALPD